MPQVDGDPVEMRAFAAHLAKFSESLKGLNRETRSRMAHLSQSWRDQDNARFSGKYEVAIKPMDHLVNTLDEYRAFLLRKAQADVAPQHIVSLSTQGYRIIVGDVQQSVTYVVYKPSTNKLLPFVDDTIARWTTCTTRSRAISRST